MVPISTVDAGKTAMDVPPVPSKAFPEPYTAGKLRKIAPLLSADTQCDEIFRQFIAKPQISGFAIQENDGSFGLVDRVSFISLFALPYRPELYGHKPIRDLMERQPLCVDVTMSVRELSATIMTRYPQALHTGFIITKGGQYAGLGRGIDLLQVLLREMEDMLAQLYLSQAALVRKEKMAALGSLVAGVSHEVNTPIGITYTVATHLAESSAEIRQKYTTGRMSKNDFQNFLSDLDESLQLLLSNTRRATELIKSFKMMAVDQTSGERRTFNLHDYIKEVLLNLRPRLKKTAHQISVECPSDLQTDSYPGALSQILSNLILNSLLHAYSEDAAGHLTIQVTQPNSDYVELRYSDDGCGIPPEQQQRVFEPFFTTQRNNGGSGLGLHLVYNLTTGVLHGQVEMESQPGRGTLFTIRFPRIAPRHPA